MICLFSAVFFFVAALAALTGQCPACAVELLKGALLFLDGLRVEKKKECLLKWHKDLC